MADSFARSFEEAFTAYRRLDSIKSDPDRVASVDERIQMSYDLFKLDNLEMARVLTMIEETCPAALSRKLSSEEVLVNIDGLTPRCFHDINTFILACIMNNSTFAKDRKKKRAITALPFSEEEKASKKK